MLCLQVPTAGGTIAGRNGERDAACGSDGEGQNKQSEAYAAVLAARAREEEPEIDEKIADAVKNPGARRREINGLIRDQVALR